MSNHFPLDKVEDAISNVKCLVNDAISFVLNSIKFHLSLLIAMNFKFEQRKDNLLIKQSQQLLAAAKRLLQKVSAIFSADAIAQILQLQIDLNIKN